MALADRLDEIASGSRDLRDFLRTDRMFHDVIAQAGDNVAIRAMMRDLHRYMSSNWEESRIRKPELPLLARQHRVIFEAVAARDPEAARAAMVEHISLASQIETERAN